MSRGIRPPSGQALRALAALALIALAGCGNDGDHLAAAQAAMRQHDGNTALVHLKVALQRTPDSAAARFLFGRLLLERGDAPAAAIELGKARSLGHPAEQVLPLLGRALLLQGDASGVLQLLQEGAALPTGALAELQTSAAAAHFQKGDQAAGDALLADALRLAPQTVSAQVLHSRRLASGGDLAGALAASRGTVQHHPGDAAAWLLHAQLLGATEAAPAEVAAAYRQVIALHGDVLRARTSLLGLLVRHKDLAAADKELEALRTQLPEHPATAYFETTLALHRGDTALARRGADKLVAKDPTQPVYARLAASVSLESGELAKAASQLTAALQAHPGDHALRRMLALTLVRNGEARQALAALAPLVVPASRDAEALALAAVASLQMNDGAQARAYFERAGRHAPQHDTRLRATLALGQLAGGDGLAALQDLESLAAADSGGAIDVALISARIQRRDYGAALQALAALERKRASDPVVPLLRGDIHLRRGEREAARSSFEQAARMAPHHFPAAAALADLDLRDQAPARARARFVALLDRDPANAAALLALARIDTQLDAPPRDVARLLAEAVRSAPMQVAPRLRQIEHALHHGRWHEALAAADEAVQALPADTRLQAAQASACIAAREFQRAASVLGKLVTAQPDAPQPLRQLAHAQMALGRTDAARETLQRATRLAPGSPHAWVDLVRLEIGQGRLDAARQVARGLQAAHPSQALGHLLQGEAAVAAKAWGEAEAAYAAALARSPGSVQAAIGLHGALLGAGKAALAERHATRWAQEHPQAADFTQYLGDRALLARDHRTAQKLYLAAVRVRPDSAAAWNNLAWVAHQLGSAEALSHAQRAVRLRPAEASFADTLAQLLGAAAQWPAALQQQAHAVELAPHVPAYRLRLAQLYLQSGDRDRARQELDRLHGVALDAADRTQAANLRRLL
ncbi:XrtA/PEP-CTERM system TPR-repeat protein PrsT [Rubrivivax sp. RP6-9]|uniref:XrtA/PEP-CTERM system TPR-repeat protein PrsT n=1 Tax=Rubrivivax sp. RP6-9 TaxID=3415750 RepID=UPI003CC629CC